MIKGANVTVMVDDMKRAIDFYTGTLGLKLKSRYGDDFAQVETPGTVIALHPRVKKAPSSVSGISIGFEVDDLEKTMADLKQKGVSFSRTTDDAQVSLAFFSDLDGTPLYLSKSKWG